VFNRKLMHQEDRMELFFWITSLLFPFLMALMALLFIYRPPKRINALSGYRTARSMASQEAWDAAHAIGGRVWIKIAPCLAAAVVILRLAVPLPPEILALIAAFAGLAGFIAPIPYVEKKLEQKFGK
jgi:uncharacterized membrane protein